MPRIIKANQVNITDDYFVHVPEKNLIIPREYDENGDVEGEEEQLSPEEMLEQAEQSASRIVENAKETADRIMEEAKEQAEIEKDAVLGEAYRQGYEKGYQEAKKEAEEIVKEAEKTLREAHEEKERLLREAEPEAVAVVIDTIEKLAGDIVKLNPGVIMHLIKAGIEGAPGAKQLFIRVSTDDYELAAERVNEVEAYVDSDTKITVIKDTSLSQGDCVIDTPIGSVDSSLGTQLSAMKMDLIQIMKTWS